MENDKSIRMILSQSEIIEKQQDVIKELQHEIINYKKIIILLYKDIEHSNIEYSDNFIEKYVNELKHEVMFE